jgi:GntR family transcriptional regulator/MocR family aminotransferase
MRIPLDRSGVTPLFRQVEAWLASEIRAGALPGGTRLPATRALAEELGVSRITVVNAYAELASAGLVVTGEGSGTFVAADRTTGTPVPAPEPAWPPWQQQLPELPDRVESAPPITHPEPIAFTGVGDPRLFPVSDLERTVREVLRRDGVRALGYGGFDGGYEPLRATIAQVLSRQGIQARPEHVLVTSGSQQALALVCEAVLRPGDTVLVEAPTYDGALELFRTRGLTVVAVPVDTDGMRVELLEPVLQQRHPRMIYTVPNFANPTGAVLSGRRRRTLLELAATYNVPVLEDDFVGDLRYEGRAQPAVKALDAGGQVLYAGTFSKLVMPGLRVGYLVAEGPVLDRVLAHKRAQDLTTSPLLQRVLDRYVTVGRYVSHLRRTTRLYRARRDALVDAVTGVLPGVGLDPPSGGLFAWLRLPEGVSAHRLDVLAREEGVEMAPGGRFFPDPHDGDGFVRLNFATLTSEEIGIGVARLRRALERCA